MTSGIFIKNNIFNTGVAMKLIEIVEMIQKEKPDFLGKIPEKHAAAIIRESLRQIAAQVEAMDEGQIKVPGFGEFNVRQVEREKEGQKETIKRIVFRPAHPNQAE
jgi:nucleoid DNA-binding protein